MHEFPNSTEFERFYFAPLLRSGGAKDAVTDDLAADIPPEIEKILSHSEFNADPPFSEGPCDFELTLDKGIMLRCSSAKFLGRVVTELLAKSVSIIPFVHTDFQEVFKNLLKELSADRKPEPQLFLFVGENKKVWVIEIDTLVDGKNIKLIAHDHTRKVAKAMGKDLDASGDDDSKSNLKPLDLVLFRYTNVQNKDARKWTTRTAALLQKANLWPAGNRTKFIAIRYEDDNREKAEFNHPFIDDLLCLPLDRLILLQKIEIALNLPKKISPTFLYVQKVDEPIEISKRVVIERVSDLGIAISNPIPLASGTVGHFYFKFPGQKTYLDLYGKVSKSIPHPDRAGENLAFFNFFGLNKNLNKDIKAFLGRDTAYKNLIDPDAENFHFNPENLFVADDQKRIKTVAILDYEENVIKSASDYIKNEIDNVEIVTDDTFFSFQKRFLSRRVDASKAPPIQSADFFADNLSFLISIDDRKFHSVLTQAKDADLFMGHEILKVFAEPEGWLKLFSEDTQGVLSEYLSLVKSVKRLTKLVDLVGASGEARSASLELVYEEISNMARLTFRVPDAKLIQKNAGVQKIDSLDCVLIDYDLLPDDINSLVKALKEGAKTAGLKASSEGPKIIVTVNENRKINFQKLVNSKVYGFMYKPLEIRRLLYLVATAIDSPFTIYSFENIGWKKENIVAKIARDAEIVELGEFGATIRCEQPLKPGTMLYLFKSIFENAPDQNLCARIYHSEEDDSSPGKYLNSIVYFGITDAFLKYTRSYIRETYAAKKAKEIQG